MSNQNIEFTKEDLEKVAMLSRLRLEEDEKEMFLGQIKEILGYVGQVSDMADGEIESSGGENYGKKWSKQRKRACLRQ
jgi:Asp-tRNA(Asn)/Glu-tRNA(Gln) amidotransferase C subunit